MTPIRAWNRIEASSSHVHSKWTRSKTWSGLDACLMTRYVADGGGSIWGMQIWICPGTRAGAGASAEAGGLAAAAGCGKAFGAQARGVDKKVNVKRTGENGRILRMIGLRRSNLRDKGMVVKKTDAPNLAKKEGS